MNDQTNIESYPEPLHINDVGSLCAGWSFLEAVTDVILRNVLGVTPKVAGIICEFKDIASRWKLIVQNAEGIVSEDEFKLIKSINKHILDVTKDRNIIVHGQIIAAPHGTEVYAMITRGEHAGKLFPMTKDAVKTVMENIQRLADAARTIIQAHDWKVPPLTGERVSNWPTPIPLSL